MDDLQLLLDEVIPAQDPAQGAPLRVPKRLPPAGSSFSTQVTPAGVPPGGSTGGLQWPSGAAKGISRVKYTHDAMVDQIIANPAISQNELALIFGYSASWISQVLNSDAFQVRLAERQEALVDPAILHSMDVKLKGIMARSMEILAEKLDRPSASIPDNLVLQSFNIASKAAGYGAKVEQASPNKVDINIHLETLGENLTGLLRRKRLEIIQEDSGQ